MGLIKEFREFALKGNVLDLAVGVIIGAAFGGIVKSLIDDVIMPVVGKAIGNVDFSNLYVSLSDKVSAAKDARPSLSLKEARELGAVLAWGNFVTIILNFLILAFCIFLVVKAFNTAKARFEEKKESGAAPPTPTEKLLMEIRDELKGQRAR